MKIINEINFPDTLPKLVSNVIAGLVVGLCVIIAAVSFAGFIFSGHLSDYFHAGFTTMMTGTTLVLLVTTLSGTLPITIAVAQEDSLAIYAVIATSIAGSMATQGPDAVLSTILICNVITGLLTGLFFLGLGTAKLGNLISYIPYPVIGGFLAGVGWFLFKGAFDLLIPDFHGFSSLFTNAIVMLQWMPAACYALILIALNKHPSPYKWPLMIVSGLVIFYSLLAIFHIPLHVAREQGFLFNFETSSVHPVSLRDISLNKVDWNTVYSQLPNMLIIMLLSTIGYFLYSKGLETILKKNMDTNRELCVSGIGNILSGLVGGTNGYVAISFSAFNQEIQQSVSSNSRLAGLIMVGLCIPFIFMGASLLAYVPRFIGGTLLMFLGITLLKDWVYDLRNKLPLNELLIVVLILFIIAFFGIPTGILMGILFSVGFFTVQVSNVSVIKSMLTGIHIHSNKQYPPQTRELLFKHADEILYYQLQNFLFFGNADSLLQNLISQIEKSNKIRYVIFDYTHITGLDYSAIVIFTKIKELIEGRDVRIILTNLNKKNDKLIKTGNVINTALTIFPNADEALEWCETDIIKRYNIPISDFFHLEDKLIELANDREVIHGFHHYFERVTLAKGSNLFHAGEEFDGLYYIESGQLTVYIEAANIEAVKPTRIRTICPGNIVGEIALYTEQKRSASIMAAEDCVLQKLTKENLAKMEHQNPELASFFSHYIVLTLSERLLYANKIMLR